MGDAPVRMFVTEDGDAYVLPYTTPKTVSYVRADLVEQAIAAAEWEPGDAQRALRALRDALTSRAIREGGESS